MSSHFSSLSILAHKSCEIIHRRRKLLRDFKSPSYSYAQHETPEPFRSEPEWNLGGLWNACDDLIPLLCYHRSFQWLPNLYGLNALFIIPKYTSQGVKDSLFLVMIKSIRFRA